MIKRLAVLLMVLAVLPFVVAQYPSEGGTVTPAAESTITEEVPLGKGLAEYFGTVIDHSDLSNLFDGAMTWGGDSYDTSEALEMADQHNPMISTSLTQGEDDFKTNIYMTVARGKMVYRYRFDETVNISTASTTNPIIINFLGKILKITDVNDADTFSVYVGDEHNMTVGESVTVSGKTITLTSVSTTKAVVTVDGVTQSISSGSAQTVNGIQITVASVYSADKLEESTAILILGTISSKTYNDGDAYVGENETDPDWVWTVDRLTALGTNQVLGVKNYFRKIIYTDGPTGVGECYNFPDSRASVCFDGLTVADADLESYRIAVGSSIDLNQALGSAYASSLALRIHTPVTDGIELRPFDTLANVNSIIKANNVWLSLIPLNDLDETSASTDKVLAVFYYDTFDSRVKYFGAINPTAGNGATILRANYENTKDDNIVLKYNEGSSTTNTLNLTWDINADSTTDLEDGADDIKMVWGIVNGNFNRLGITADTEEARELLWGSSPTLIGSKDEDHRTRYGIIVRNPKSNSGAERVLLSVPPDQVYARVSIKATPAIVIPTPEPQKPSFSEQITAIEAAVANIRLTDEYSKKTRQIESLLKTIENAVSRLKRIAAQIAAEEAPAVEPEQPATPTERISIKEKIKRLFGRRA